MDFKLFTVLQLLCLATSCFAQLAPCPTCNEEACCSAQCPNSFFCSVTSGQAPECFDSVTGMFWTSRICKRPNCESCTSAQISCAGVTRICRSTATHGVCSFNY
ncbi:hypothetical protein Fcan01_17016 [Folsomia candida]|uniref:Uncharacterized protein n=1 Tax=Folsomia candida TaxID=158441 RepID=A0A226DT02_FOLCA|nr:hypothetical protein Fcan01_17016 [Folsomia candida]